MALLAPFDRPLALHLLGASRRAPVEPSHTRRPAVPAGIDPPGAHPPTADPLLHTARFLARALLSDAATIAMAIPELESRLDERVVAWSPSLSTSTRVELVSALLESDDAISDVQVAVSGECVSGSTAYIEWRLQGRFDNAGFLNDDLLVEPSGSTVACAGVLVLGFAHGRVASIRCFYDGLGLLEQVLRPVE